VSAVPDADRPDRRRFVPPGDDRLPESLAHVQPRFAGLWLAGDASLLERGPRIGVIGSRRPRADAAEAARRIARDAGRAGFTVVSGLAIGIDGVAHAAALDAGAPTIAVLAGGLARVQPSSNRSLAVRIAGERRGAGVAVGHRDGAPGLVVTEYGAGDEQAYPYRFRDRNRIIAALSDYLVVVQARHVSGSMITASVALDLGIQVGVLPSSPDDECHSGTMALIHDGADAVVDGASLFRRLELHGIMRRGFADAAARGARIDPDDRGGWIGGGEHEQLGLPAHPLLAHLTVPRTAEELADLAALPLADVRMQLLDLEDDGFVEHRDDGAWTSVRPTGGSSYATL
jgi:DNA processing protein